MTEFGAVDAPTWNDATAYLVGGGSSLAGFDFNRLRGRGHVLAVNQAMFDAPCEAGVTVDHIFVRNRADLLRSFAASHRLYLVLGNEWWKAGLPLIKGAVYLRSEMAKGLSRQRDLIHRGATSGFAALNVAVLKGAKRIVLLGFDYSAIDRQSHYHNAYPWHRPTSDASWPVWARRYADVALDCEARGIEVINASPRSALQYFRKCSIDEVLGECAVG